MAGRAEATITKSSATWKEHTQMMVNVMINRVSWVGCASSSPSVGCFSVAASDAGDSAERRVSSVSKEGDISSDLIGSRACKMDECFID